MLILTAVTVFANLPVLFSRPTTVIDETASVKRVDQVVEQLSRELGKPLDVSSFLAGTLVYLKRNGAPVEVALRNLANALHASVSEGPKGLLLQRTAQDAKAFERARRLERAGWLQSRLDGVERFRALRLEGRDAQEAVLAEVERGNTVSKAISTGLKHEMEPFFATELLPSESLLCSLVRKLGTEALAAVPVGGSQVWESRPGSGELPLADYTEALDTYGAQMGALVGNGVSPQLKAKLSRLGMEAYFGSWSQEKIFPTRLRLQARADETRTVITLSGYDATGNQQLVASMIAMPTQVWRPPVEIVRKDLARPEARWIPLSPPSVALVAATPEAIARERPEWFTAPERNEPLDVLTTGSLGALSMETPDKCVAFQVVDSVWDDVRNSAVKGRLNLDALKAMLREWSLYERIESKDGVVWRPTQSIDLSECQANRRAMGQLARLALGTKSLQLRTLAHYRGTVGAQPTALTYYWERTLRQSPTVRAFSGDASHAFYRLLDEITDRDWRKLESGLQIKIKDLRVQTSVEALLDEERMPVRSVSPLADLYKHPRELFDRRLVGECSLVVESDHRSLLGIQNPHGDGIIQWSTGISMLAALQVVEDERGKRAFSMTRPEYEAWLRTMRFQLGAQDARTITVNLPEGAFLSAEFTDPVVPSTEVVEYNKLSTESKDAIWRLAQEAALRGIEKQ